MLDPKKTKTGAPKPCKRRCTGCKKLFQPHPRLVYRQKTCVQRDCQLKYRSRYRRLYRQNNPALEKESREKIKFSRQENFWKDYRRSHFRSTEHNRLNSKLRQRLKRAGLQRQLDIVQVTDPPGYFDLFHGFAMSHRSLIADCTGKDAA